MDFTTNYCGMYYSNGKIQSSVANGSMKPVNELDAACRDHDTSYALANDPQSLAAADDKFFNRATKLGIRGRLYGSLVKYGNKAARDVKMAFMVPLGLALGSSLTTGYGLSQMLPGKRGGIRGTAVSPIINEPVKPVGAFYDPSGEIAFSSDDFREAEQAAPANWGSLVDNTDFYRLVHSNHPVEGRAVRTPLYKPLGKKKKRKQARSRAALPPNNKNSEKISKPQKLSLRNIQVVPKNVVSQAKPTQAKGKPQARN